MTINTTYLEMFCGCLAAGVIFVLTLIQGVSFDEAARDAIITGLMAWGMTILFIPLLLKEQDTDQ